MKDVNNNRKTTDIVLISDPNYIMPSSVLITSIIKNKCPNTKYNINIIAVECEKKDIELLNSMSTYDVSISVHEEQNIYKNLGKNPGHVTKSALLKFNIAEIFSSLDKILYLDSDIIVQKDLYDLFSVDISNYLAAVVKDMKAIKVNHDFDGYFNSGVMLLNLKKIREENLKEKFIETKKIIANRFQDQDVFNVVFKNRVKYLSAKYNYLNRYDTFFSKKEINEFFNEDLSEIVIEHYTYKKPFEYLNVPRQKEWQKYYNLSPYKDKKLKLKELEPESKNMPQDNRTYNDKIIELYQSGITKRKRKTKIIVSLTSMPKRIDLVSRTIRSILSQTLKPDEVVLWLSFEEFPQKEKMLPKNLLELKKHGLTINWCKNLKQYNKLIHSLEKYPESILVTVDDDIIYKPCMLEKLYKAYKLAGFDNKKIYAYRVHCIIFEQDGTISKYNEWFQEIYQNLDIFNNFQTGVGGVLYPPRCLHKDVLKRELFLKLSPTADDIWFWAMGVLNDTTVKVVPCAQSNLEYVPNSQETGLFYQNCKLGLNDIQLNNVLNHYPEILDKLKRIPNFIINAKNNLVNLIKNNNDKKAVFWGASLFLDDFLEDYKCSNILGIIDKNPLKQGGTLKGYKIYAPEQLKELKPEIVIFTIKNYNYGMYLEVKKYIKKNYPKIKLLENIFEIPNQL